MTRLPPDRTDHTRRLWAIAVGVSVAGTAAAATAVALDGRGLGSVALIGALVALLTLTRCVPFLVVRRDEGEEISADEAVLVAAIVLLPAAGVLAAALSSTVLAHVVRRRDALKTTFNLGAQALAVAGGLLVEHALGAPALGSVALAALAASCIAALAYSAVSSTAIWCAVSAASGLPWRRLAADGATTDVVAALAAVGWGALAVSATTNELAALAVLAVPIALSWVVRHNEQQHRSMHAMLRAAVATGQAVRSGQAAGALTAAADEVLRAQGTRLSAVTPAPGDLAAPLRARGGRRWLVAGPRHRWDRRRRADQTLLDALAAIGDIALANEDLLDATGRDPETGLLTGALLAERIDVLLEQHRHDGLALVVVRIPRLDVVKQALGPVAARRERAEIAGRLRALVEEPISDRAEPRLLGFLGDGDFAVVLPGVASSSLALGAARSMQRALQEPVTVDGVALTVEATMGIRVCGPDEAEQAEAGDLLREAVATAARIARVGGERIQFTQPDHGRAPSLALEAELRRAVQAGELLVAYQPVVAVGGGQIVGAEALVRWKHPTRSWLPPGEFIPVAEQSRLIVEVDRHVLREVVAQLARWHEDGLPPSFAVSVNLSARHLAEPDTARFLRSLVQGTPVEPHRIRLEVTESSVTLDAVAAASTLDELHRLGFGIAIDDFGTGYSSLLYLRDFPADTLKIDRSFIERMTSSPGDAAIVAAIIRLGHTLGLSTVAEGVETDEQLVALRALGCDAAQGFLWSEAVRPERVREAWWPGVELPASNAVAAAAAHDADDAVRDDVLPYLIHELRSPLISVDAYAALVDHELAGEDPDAPARTYLDRIRHAAGAMQAVLDDLGAVSTLDLAGVALDLRTVELNGLVDAALDTIRPTVGGQPIELVAGAPVEVEVDPHRVGQVLRNLVSNAAKFSSVDQPIEVQVHVDAGGARVDVRDHGCGVPPERVGQLFRRFSRLGSTTKGMGIGLHLARKVARVHGGDVTYAAPAEGAGSVFSIHLPRPPGGPCAAPAVPGADLERLRPSPG